MNPDKQHERQAPFTSHRMDLARSEAYIPPQPADFFELGRQAAKDGQPLSAMPSDLDNDQISAWFNGWTQESYCCEQELRR